MRLRASRILFVEPLLPPGLEPLRRIAANLRWTWDPDSSALFRRVDQNLWAESGHNPVRLLQLLSPEQLARLEGDQGFRLHLQRVAGSLDDYLEKRPQLGLAASRQSLVGYFSLEFGLTESLPVYSGGLGVLAGDLLKSASDLALPLVGVGLLYRQGYFQQTLAPDGWQSEGYQEIDIACQPLERVRDESGGAVTVSVPLDSRDVGIAAWRLDVGRVPLILLDTDLEENAPADRGISRRLYDGDIETRIQQEMVLGIGGIRALHAMGLEPAVCHMNEGHSALLALDRIRTLMEDSHLSFEEALLPVTAGTVFTTHTAVAAGIDLFPPELVRKYLGHYCAALGLDDRTFLGLGRIDPNDDHEPFSMALLGLRLSGYRNAVSHVHRSVSRRLWEAAWPNLPQEQIPIDSVTNGVHLPTWVAPGIGELYDRYVGPGWRDDPARSEAWSKVEEIPQDELWATHEQQRELLVLRAREQQRETAMSRGVIAERATPGEADDARMLTVGFARRFAGYKRATLLFRDLDRLARIVNDSERPVRFFFAGKAHPRDEPGKQLIREVVEHSRRPEFRGRLVVLERYDLGLARLLVQGCDVWLNTPLRPLEASGTSGMKAVANGALHLSVLDGWWAEAYRPGAGWAIGRNRADDDPEVQDAFDADSLYDLLENEVVPCFYDRDAEGLPGGWIARMKSSIAAFAPVFNSSRMVSEYAARAYEPAARSWGRLREDGGAPARSLAAWLARVRAGWESVKVFAVEDDQRDHAGAMTPVRVAVQIHPGALSAEDLRVDIVHGPARPDGEVSAEEAAPMAHTAKGENGVCRFEGTFTPLVAGRVGYAIRVLPGHADLHNVFGAGLVLWA